MRGEFKGFFIMKQIYNDALQFCIDRCSNVASNKPIELFFAFKIDLKIDWALLDYVSSPTFANMAGIFFDWLLHVPFWKTNPFIIGSTGLGKHPVCNSVDSLNETNNFIAVWNVTLEVASLHKVKTYTIVATDNELFNSESQSRFRHL